MSRRYEGFLEPSRPRDVQGGIKAQSRRGSFASNWWAKRWLDTLESFHLGARLQRGRNYARRGQVLNVDVTPGEVKAQVQGSRSTPYKVSIKVKVLSDKEWSKVLAELSGQAIYAAKLLVGEMPIEIEEVFANAKVSLFPKRSRDLVTDCSCPDWSNPCKHIAAVYYLLGEEFDRDPFLIFRLRGMPREQLLQYLQATAASATASMPGDTEEKTVTEPLESDPSVFWCGPSLPDSPRLHTDAHGSLGLLERLGHFPMWRGEQPLQAALAPWYRAAAEKATSVGVALAGAGKPE